jgi:hypothetical protein
MIHETYTLIKHQNIWNAIKARYLGKNKNQFFKDDKTCYKKKQKWDLNPLKH